MDLGDVLEELQRRKMAIKKRIPKEMDVRERVNRGNLIEWTVQRAVLNAEQLYSHGYELDEQLQPVNGVSKEYAFTSQYEGFRRHLERAEKLAPK